MKIGSIIQARTSSTRLPSKVLKMLPFDSDITVLQQVLRRTQRSKKIRDIIIATSTDTADEPIVELSKKENVKCFRGSLENVLSRYYLAAKENGLDIIVRITSDCPCIDLEIVDDLITRHIESGADYTTNSLGKSYPHGLDAEIISFKALKQAHINASSSYEKEHVCPYIYETNKETFKINSIKAPKSLTAPDIRITIDTESDYTLLCAVFDYLYPQNEFFNAEDIIKLFDSKPWLKFINKDSVRN